MINKKKKKRIFKIVDFALPADHRIKLKECEKKDKYLDLVSEFKKLWNMKVTIGPIVRDYANYTIAENGQNPETSPGNLRRLAVIQTPVKIHQLTLMWKSL